MKKIALLVAMVVMLVGLAAPLMSLAESIPLPTDINIVPPDSNIPAEIRAFFGSSGKWRGSAEIVGWGGAAF